MGDLGKAVNDGWMHGVARSLCSTPSSTSVAQSLCSNTPRHAVLRGPSTVTPQHRAVSPPSHVVTSSRRPSAETPRHPPASCGPCAETPRLSCQCVGNSCKQFRRMHTNYKFVLVCAQPNAGPNLLEAYCSQRAN